MTITVKIICPDCRSEAVVATNPINAIPHWHCSNCGLYWPRFESCCGYPLTDDGKCRVSGIQVAKYEARPEKEVLS